MPNMMLTNACTITSFITLSPFAEVLESTANIHHHITAPILSGVTSNYISLDP
jgi:hypothetical protein